MEEHQKRHIIRNFLELVKNTDCSVTFVLILWQNNVLSDEDKAELESITNSLKKSEKVYNILLTRKGSFCHLITALKGSANTGALEILKQLREDKVAKCNSDADPSLRSKGDKATIQFDVTAPIFNFTGGEPQLHELHQKLQGNLKKQAVLSQMAAIVGLGGIGKTELARKYIQLHSEKSYEGNVIWISAESEDAISKAFRRLASKHLSEDWNDTEISTLVSKIYSQFNEQKVLFVFDNAESTDYIRNLLPLGLPSSSTSPYILITSRDREWSFSGQVLELTEMTEEDAMRFVKTSLEYKDDDDHVLSLVNRLQRYPLAISQAVSFIKQQRLEANFSIYHYLILLETDSEKLLDYKKSPAEFNTYRETTFTTWNSTTQKISEHWKFYTQLPTFYQTE